MAIYVAISLAAQVQIPELGSYEPTLET